MTDSFCSAPAIVDRELATHRDFGDSARISARTTERYLFALHLAAEHLPAMAPLLPALHAREQRADALVKDPVVRYLLERALRKLEQHELRSPDDLEAIVPRCRAFLDGSTERLPSAASMVRDITIGGSRRTWLWDLPGFPDVFADRLQWMFDWEFNRSGTHHGISRPRQETVHQLERGLELLHTLLPAVAESLREHVVSLCIANTPNIISCSGGDNAPGTIFFADAEWLGDPWSVAENFLHEALHLKLFDISRSRSFVLDHGVSDRVPWREIDWSLTRYLFSFHVYAHLVLFKNSVERAPPAVIERYGPPHIADGGLAYKLARSRARHLGHQLSGVHAKHLTTDGLRLVRWLTETIGSLDASLLEGESYVA